MGWHAFLWYGRSKINGYFQRHMVRNALLWAWEKTREHYMKVPVWLLTMGTLIHSNVSKMGTIAKYKDILNEKGEFKTKQELNEEGLEMHWYLCTQIQSRCEKDIKAKGIYKELTELDKVLTRMEGELIKRYY
uniref:Uncharacterized protein n=1 Tax=Micrurus paraensis TaxID=1970185 RepID=A0A2D4JZD9_9SAUR